MVSLRTLDASNFYHTRFCAPTFKILAETMDMTISKSFRQKLIWEKILIRNVDPKTTGTTILFQIFCNNILNSEVIVKSSIGDDREVYL